jgi:hypothetical protein
MVVGTSAALGRLRHIGRSWQILATLGSQLINQLFLQARSNDAYQDCMRNTHSANLLRSTMLGYVRGCPCIAECRSLQHGGVRLKSA